MNPTKDQAMVLALLRDNVEGTMTEPDGTVWGSVYLDNARPDGMKPRAFAAHLSNLSQSGLYRDQDDDCFGYVVLP